MLRIAKLVSWISGLLLLPALAAATPVAINGVQVSGALGVFDTSGFVPQQAEMQHVGDRLRFEVATLRFDLRAAVEDLVERANDEFTLQASFEFANPVASVLNVAARGWGIVRRSSDAPAELVLRWQPMFMAFGERGRLGLQLDDLVLTDAGPKRQTAVLTLLQAAALPEPGTLALIGLALFGAFVSTAAARRGI